VNPSVKKVKVVDSHTEGEPTRVVLEGAPDLGGGSVAEKAKVFRERFDWFRSAVVNEPRGNDAIVGALIVPPSSPRAVCGVIFFNNVSTLHACGHGTIGLAATLSHLGRIGKGKQIVETPVGEVTFALEDDGSIAIENVPSWRHAAGVEVAFEFEGKRRQVVGDVAWGGNWFFLSHHDAIEVRPSRLGELMAATLAIKMSLLDRSITGDDGGEIDHIELFGPPVDAANHSRNFVLCPGAQYDRSPCGTGTSAKLAVLHARGDLALGEEWRQESIVGGLFIGRLERMGDELVPLIRGRAFISARATLLYDPRDPFRTGLR